MARPIIPHALILESAAELQAKSEQDIELETAIRWGARAIAAYEMGNFLSGEDYFHEALEHAALVGDLGESVGRIQQQVDPVRRRAMR
jgi:hypothetical protein